MNFHSLVDSPVKIASGILGLAIVGVLVSKNATTAAAIQAAASGFSNILGTVIAPVSGSGAATSAASTADPAPADTASIDPTATGSTPSVSTVATAASSALSGAANTNTSQATASQITAAAAAIAAADPSSQSSSASSGITQAVAPAAKPTFSNATLAAIAGILGTGGVQVQQNVGPRIANNSPYSPDNDGTYTQYSVLSSPLGNAAYSAIGDVIAHSAGLPNFH